MAQFETVPVYPDTKEELDTFKFDSRCRSYEEAVSELLRIAKESGEASTPEA